MEEEDDPVDEFSQKTHISSTGDTDVEGGLSEDNKDYNTTQHPAGEFSRYPTCAELGS